MGNLCSNEIRTEEEDMASRDIERQLKEDEEKFKKISRLLLLGKFDFFFFSPKNNATNVFVFDEWTRCVILFLGQLCLICLFPTT